MAFNAEFPGSQGKKGNQMGYKVLLSEILWDKLPGFLVLILAMDNGPSRRNTATNEQHLTQVN